MATESSKTRNKEWICTDCGNEKKYEFKEQADTEWSCEDCQYNANLIKWEKFICPIMNRYRNKKDAIRCFTVQCAAFERDAWNIRCRLIHYDHYLQGFFT